MKTLLILLLSSFAAMAQPILRNDFTTNNNDAARLVSTNISAGEAQKSTNVFSLNDLTTNNNPTARGVITGVVSSMMGGIKLATNSQFTGAFLRATDSGTNREYTVNGGSLTNLNAGSMVGLLSPDHIGTGLPGLLVRPVQASPAGVISAPTWPDDNTYYFDEEFDAWQGSSSGQFGRWKWTANANGGGGGVINVSSNQAPYFGIIALQSPTTTGNTFVISQYGSTGALPYSNLGITSNWLFHAVFFLGNSNQGSIYRIGLEDFGFNLAATSMNPSNSIMLRWDKNKADKETFVFEARSNAIVQTNFSTIQVATNIFFKVTFMCTNAGTVNCSVNGETWVTLTNIPIAPLCITAMDATTNATAQNLWLDRLSFMASSMNR